MRPQLLRVRSRTVSLQTLFGRLRAPRHQRRRAKHTGTTMERRHADAHCNEKRKGIYRQREDRPAEQGNANGVEEKSKRKHGDGSVHISAPVAPSTTTAAQPWIYNRNE